MHDYANALKDLNKAVSLGDILARGQRGWVCYKMGNYDSAIVDITVSMDSFDQITRMAGIQNNDQSKASSYIMRGLAYAGKRDYDMALADISLSLKFDNSYALGYVIRGNIYATIGAFDDANADYTHAIQLDIRNATAYYYRGLLFLVKGDFDKALYNMNEAVKIDEKIKQKYELMKEAIDEKRKPQNVIFELDILDNII
jgi:tetratricopeptide (TPR) repeat protein